MNDSYNEFNSDNMLKSSLNLLNYRSLDDFLEMVCSKDTNVRLDAHSKLEEYLKYSNSDLSCYDLSKFTEAILQWISCSNFKISINGLSIMQLLIQRLTEPLRNHTTESMYSFYHLIFF